MFGKIFITQLRNCLMLVTPLVSASSRFVGKTSEKEDRWSEIRSAQRDANTYCALAVAIKGGTEKNRPAADPLPGGAGRPKFNKLEMVTTFTYEPSLVRIDACNFGLSW